MPYHFDARTAPRFPCLFRYRGVFSRMLNRRWLDQRLMHRPPRTPTGSIDLSHAPRAKVRFLDERLQQDSSAPSRRLGVSCAWSGEVSNLHRPVRGSAIVRAGSGSGKQIASEERACFADEQRGTITTLPRRYFPLMTIPVSRFTSV